MAKYFRKGMKARIHPQLVTDPFHLRGKTVKIQRVVDGIAIVRYKKKKGYYFTDTLLRVSKTKR